MTISEIPYYMVKCLIMTILIELIISIILGVRYKKDVLYIILINICTNLIVTSIPILCNVYLGIIYRNITLIILEILTFIIEGFTYSKVLKYKKLNPYLLSLILNGFSYILGILIN